MYKEVDPKADFPEIEEEVLDFWHKNETFKKSIEQRRESEEFVAYDATGCREPPNRSLKMRSINHLTLKLE